MTLASSVDLLAENPAVFSVLRKILEVGFVRQKRWIQQLFTLTSENRVLDIGCGTGEFAPLFKIAHYWGIDISRSYAAHARKKTGQEILVMDGNRLAFKSERFDYILIMAVLHHLKDEAVIQVLAEAKRVLKPEGRVLVMEDTKIEAFDSLLVRWVQKYDKGAYIRNSQAYKAMISDFFTIKDEWPFRSGACAYAAFFLEKPH